MSSLIDVAVQHFSSLSVREVPIPEWDTTCYAKNLTLEDKAKLSSRSNNDWQEYMVYAIIFGLVDEAGDPVFTIKDKVKLLRFTSPAIIERIASVILSHQSETEEDREKN